MFNVLILGSGRSGTSMVAGSLKAAGYFMGDRLYPARDSNPRGFFEDPEVNGVNEALLARHVPAEQRLGPNQLWLAQLERSVPMQVTRPDAQRMGALLARAPWCFKDPRFSYTLPAWRPWIGAAKFVCVFRDPAITAASIVKECRSADYLRGVAVDPPRALAIWRAHYRQILADHRHQGDWLFLHYDQVVAGDGLERLGEFLGAPVDRSFPTGELSRSRAAAPADGEAQRMYAELCELAGHREGGVRSVVERGATAPPPEPPPERGSIAPPPSARAGGVPELSVLICSYRRKETLLECLRSFDAQTVAPERIELVVVVDGDEDGTGDAVRALSLRTPLRLLARASNAGLAAARSTAVAMARGELLLIVNDDTIAFPDLVERHLAAHRARGARRAAVLGTFEQPPEQLRSALMNVLERSALMFGYAGLAAGEHDWMKFWGCNVSVAREAVLAAGAFDATFRRYGCEDTDLGLRLAALGMPVVYEPAARAWHRHVLSLEEFAKRQRTVARAYVHLFAKHPVALDHPAWYRCLAADAKGLAAQVARNAPVAPRLIERAAKLASVDVAELAARGSEGAALAQRVGVELEKLLAPLNVHWWNEGFVEGLVDLGVASFAELRAWRAEGAEPWPLQSPRAVKLLAWPRWDDAAELAALLQVVADPRIAPLRPCLCLRHDAALDGPLDEALARLQAASREGLPRAVDAEVLVVGELIEERELPRLGRAVTAALLRDSSDAGERRRFFARVAAPGVRGADDLLALLPAAAEVAAEVQLPAAERSRIGMPVWAELSV
ncbi:MAG: glycosyltransferase [Planctomycetes bacterium]|nr:glycosyltransferase [Planctomycetota bacterium]